MDHVPRKKKSRLDQGYDDNQGWINNRGDNSGGGQGLNNNRGDRGQGSQGLSNNRGGPDWSNHGGQVWDTHGDGRQGSSNHGGGMNDDRGGWRDGRGSNSQEHWSGGRTYSADWTPHSDRHAPHHLSYRNAPVDFNEGRPMIQPMPSASNPPDAMRLQVAPTPVELSLNGAPTSEEWFDTEDMMWDNLTHVQKVKYLTPRLKRSGRLDVPDVSFFDNLPPEMLHSDFVSVKRKEKMESAAQAAEATVHHFFTDATRAAKTDKEEENDSSEDYSTDGEYDNPYRKKEQGFEWGNFLSEGFAIEFIRGLPKHLLFTASFDASGSDEAHSQLCHCPCSTKKSRQWLKLIGFDGLIEENAYKTRFSACNNRTGTFRHFALLAHLKQLKNDPLHLGIYVYITELYKNYYGPFHHEALYKNDDDTKFNKVIAYKTRQLETKLADLRANQRKYRERRDKLIKENEAVRAEVEKNRAIYDQLNMVGNDKAKDLPKEVISKLSRLHEKFMKVILKANQRGKAEEDELLCISSEEINQPFDLTDTFDNWSAKTGKADKSCLFRELDAKTRCKILSIGEWNFSAHNGGSESEKGVDEGGLTRMFFDGCWKQMGELAVVVEGTKIKLFEEEDCGINPLPDENVQDHIRRVFKLSSVDELDGHDGAVFALKKAQHLYRAFGRIMCHSLATHHVLPCNLLPGILRSYLFCGKKPTERDYPPQELFPHLKELNLLKVLQDCGFEGGGDEFRGQAENLLIEGRSVALNSILEGLTLDSEVNFQLFFAGREVQVVDEILFAPSIVTADMIIKHLKSCKLVGDVSSTDFDSTQRRFVDETFPALLRKKEAESGSEFLRQFLKHVTGLSYINRKNPTIKICLEHLNDNSLPVAHTCEQELSVPLTAYDANVDTLEYYLEKAMEHCSVPGYEITMQ